MENSSRNCIIARLIILVSSLVLSIVTALLFAVGILPLAPVVFTLTAVLGGWIVLAVLFAVVVLQPYECVRRCVLCLGLMSFFAALALLVLSIIAIATGIVLEGVLSAIFLFFVALAFWVAITGFMHFVRCIAHREA